MLRQILDRLRAGGTWTVEELARDLGTSVPLVETALEDLARRGYLVPAAGSCSSGGCAACGAAGSCIRGAAKHDGHDLVWALVR